MNRPVPPSVRKQLGLMVSRKIAQCAEEGIDLKNFVAALLAVDKEDPKSIVDMLERAYAKAKNIS